MAKHGTRMEIEQGIGGFILTRYPVEEGNSDGPSGYVAPKKEVVKTKEELAVSIRKYFDLDGDD